MANLLTGDAIYISIQDVRDSTKNPHIIALTDQDIQSLIYQSQIQIDLYIRQTRGASWECGQGFLFPIKGYDCDYAEQELIPKEIQIATLFTVEYLFLNGYDTNSASLDIKSEKTGPHSVDFGDNGSAKQFEGLTIPKSAIQMLSKRKNVFYRPML